VVELGRWETTRTAAQLGLTTSLSGARIYHPTHDIAAGIHHLPIAPSLAHDGASKRTSHSDIFKWFPSLALSVVVPRTCTVA
jgi:hypothetical protein